MAVVVRVPCHGHAPARIWSSTVETSAPAGWEAPLPAAALELGATLRSGGGGTRAWEAMLGAAETRYGVAVEIVW